MKRQTGYRLTERSLNWLAKESQRRGISMNDIVQELINHAMERPEKPTTTTKMQRRNEDEC